MQTLTKYEVLAIADPTQHTLLAHEPTDQELKVTFVREPSSLVVVTPTQVHARRRHINKN